METGWVPGRERETGSRNTHRSLPERLLEREILGPLSSGLWAAVDPQTRTSLVFKNTWFAHYNMDEPKET